MKKAFVNIILLIGCIVFATMTVASADGEVYGWKEFFLENYGTEVPEIVQKIIAENGEIQFSLGPVDFYVGGQYYDGNIAMISTVAKLSDGTNALLTGDDPFDPIGSNGENGDQAAERIGVNPDLSWAQAAKALNLPLYSIRAILEIPEELASGDQTEDEMFNKDGSLTYFSMAFMNKKADDDKINVRIFLRIAQIDPDNPETKLDNWTERIDIILPKADSTWIP